MPSAAMLAAFLALPRASAELPLPLQPECGTPDRPDLCPPDMEGDWWLLSNIPDNAIASVRSEELELGPGIGADLAFRTSTGRWDLTVAVLDSGIEWQNGDLVNKVRLNTGELPMPQDASGQEHGTWDLDGNGLVNVQDYADDPRVDPAAGDDVADHMLDPSDLIMTFSDGVDDDGNGYVDDIAGWDFFSGDNDPWNTYDAGYGTHGSGVMEDAVAEAANGDGDVGVCPNCSLLPVRIGDTFVVDGARTGEGVAFATDSGASVVAMAVGAMSNPPLVQQSLAYAREQGVLVVAAAGDENSFHHNFPAVNDDVLYVHSVRANTADDDGAVYSYMNFFNCNNYGPRVELVAGSTACATGAVALISGAAGLVMSAARDRGMELSPGQVRQLLVATVDDVYLTPDELDRAATYPSSPGWDPFYGYGRVNVARAVQAVVDGQIPPEARLTGPGWFQVLYPGRTPTVEVDMDMSAADGGSLRWELACGRGWEPQDWQVLDTGSEGGSVTGRAWSLDIRGISTAPVPEPDLNEGVLERVRRVHAPAVTLRLRVTDSAGRVGEARRTFFVHRDPDLLQGFPFALGASGESSPILADVDGDGVFEIVAGSSDGAVHVLDGTGQELDGWPVLTDRSRGLEDWESSAAYASGQVDGQQPDGIMATVAVGDLDADGSPEIVAASGGGQVYAWDAGGRILAGFPVSIVGREPDEFDETHVYDNGIAGAPTLYDVDGDGDLEIVVAAMDSRLYVWHHDGSAFAGYPIEVCHPSNCGVSGAEIVSSVSVGDVDGDGDVDFGLGTNETLDDGRYSVSHVIDAESGEELPGWPRKSSGLVAEAALLPMIGTGHPASMAFADLDGDGTLEILDAIMLGQTGVIGHGGDELMPLAYSADRYGPGSNTNEPSFVSMTNNPAFGDMDGDGVPDALMGGAGTYAVVGLALTTAIDFQHVLGGWSGATGEFLEGWPRQVEDFQFLVAPAVADLDGDGRPEAVYASAGYVVHAWNAAGDSPPGWPKFTGQWVLGSPAVGDIDGDGYLDVAVTTREGWLYAWRSSGPADQHVEWASIHHDPRNTGNYETPLAVQAGPIDVSGGCCRKNGEPAEAWIVAPLLLVALRRRRGMDAERPRR